MRDLMDVTQRKMIRRMCRIHTGDETDPETLHRIVHSRISDYFRKFHIRSWSELVDLEYFGWAGRLVRQAEANPDRLTGKMCKYKQLATNFDYAKRHRGYQGHGLKFQPWRLETEIFNFFHHKGQNWQEEAMDFRQWRALEEDFVRWKKLSCSERSINC